MNSIVITGASGSMGKWFDPLADLLFRPFCKSPEKGAAPAVRALCTEESGKYFVGDRIKTVPKRVYARMDAEDLWERTMELIRRRQTTGQGRRRRIPGQCQKG